MGDDLRPPVAEIGEGEGGRHPALDVGLAPHELLGFDDLYEDAAARVFGAVGIVHHDGFEDPARAGVDLDVLDGRAHTDRTPEVGEVLGRDHAAEYEVTRGVVDPGVGDLSEIGRSEVGAGVVHVDGSLASGWVLCTGWVR